jgi:hypothetical protein
MITRSHPRTIAMAVAFALLATLLACTGRASAAVTSSAVTSPADGSYFQNNNNNLADPAHQMTVSGTTTGSGDVDLICTFGAGGTTTGDSPIDAGVPVASDDTFSVTLPAPSLNRPCVVRAVPAGGGLPANLTPFTGPRIASGTLSVAMVAAGPNTGLSFDFDDDAPQFSGEGDYFSVGHGGLFNAHPFDPLTFNEGADLFLGGDYLSDANTDRSDVEVDGVPAYASYTAANVVGGAQTFAGLPALTFSSGQNPTTGDLTIHESEMLVECEPDPAVYPATTSSCRKFQSTGVRFDRTIVQDEAGRQTHLTDTYTSVDGSAHTVDLRYGQDFASVNAGFDFPWVDSGAYEPHTAGDTVTGPPSGPATVFLKFNNSLPDGDESSAQGAITFAQAPSGFEFLTNGLSASNGKTHLFASFTRDVPAGGSATLRTAYSWAFTQADVQSLAAVAAQSFTPPAVVTGAATAITTTTAELAATVNANAQPTTYQLQYGTTTSYGQSTPVASAGAGTSPAMLSAGLSGLKANTTYHYRVVATNASGTSAGADQTFETVNLPTRLTVGRIKVKGETASVPLSCTGNPGAICRASLTEKARVHRSTKTVGHAQFSIGTAVAKTVKIKLNRTGRRALAHSSSRRLRVRLTVRLGTTSVAARTISFKRTHRR